MTDSIIVVLCFCVVILTIFFILMHASLKGIEEDVSYCKETNRRHRDRLDDIESYSYTKDELKEFVRNVMREAFTVKNKVDDDEEEE